MLTSGPRSPSRSSVGHPSGVRGGPALVHGRDQPQLTGQSEIVACRFHRGIVWAQDGRAETDPASHTPLQPFQFRSWMRDFPEPRLPGCGIRLGRTVEERSADARLVQSVDASVVVGRGRIVVAPIHQRRRAAVDLVERADERCDVKVLRTEYRGETGMHLLEVFK